MKTLIFNGSPRKNGDTIRLINEMLETLEGEHKIINAYDRLIQPCNDCRYCWQQEGCSIDDPMQEIYKDFNTYDNLIIASPLYFNELTGELLSVMSRMQMVFAQQVLRKNSSYKYKNKKGILILVGGGDHVTQPAVNRANMFFNMTSTTCLDQVFSLDTNTLPAHEDLKALEDARKAAQLLNDSYEKG